MQRKSIAILGYGWLGTPLAQHFQSHGYDVKASTTTPAKLDSIKTMGLQAYLLSMEPHLECEDRSFFDSNIIIVNFPPRRRPDIIAFHTEQIKALIAAIHPESKVIFISSTSVYPPTQQKVSEECSLPAEKLSGKALQIAEAELQNALGNRLTILRFGGLVGDDRVPGRFLAGKKDIKNGDAPVNLIHRDDCISIISAVIEKECYGKVFNACMPEHPTRKAFYTAAAEKAKLPIPEFLNGRASYKIIDSSKLEDLLAYKFKYPNPMDIL